MNLNKNFFQVLLILIDYSYFYTLFVLDFMVRKVPSLNIYEYNTDHLICEILMDFDTYNIHIIY